MSTVRYSIHGLIDVLVDSRVCQPVIGGIEFQISYFKASGDMAAAPYHINVRPYGDFLPSEAFLFERFHLSRGVRGMILDDPNGRIAVQKEAYGYSIYTDTQNFVLLLFLQLLLLEHGISLVHAAAVADADGRITLLPGAGGVGKTALLGFMVKEHNYRPLGDDIVGLSKKGECFSFPRSFVLKEYHRSVYPELFDRLQIATHQTNGIPTWGFISKGLRFMRANAPMMGVSKSLLGRLGLLEKIAGALSMGPGRPFLAAVPVEEVFGPGIVADQGVIERIVFLERYSGAEFSLEPISEESLCRRMLAIIHHECVDGMRQFLAMGALELMDLLAYFDGVAAIMRSGISGKRQEVLLIPENSSPHDLAEYFVSATNAADRA